MPIVTICGPFAARAIARFTVARKRIGAATIWSLGKNPTTPSPPAPARPTPAATAAPVSRRIGSPMMFFAGISGSSRRVAFTRSFDVTT